MKKLFFVLLVFPAFAVAQDLSIKTGGSYTIDAAKVGVGSITPTARLHLPAGTATANTAPLKLTTGTALTTPEDGAIEYHTSHLWFTIGSTRYQLDQQAGGGGSGTVSSGTVNQLAVYTGTGTTVGPTNNKLVWDITNEEFRIGNPTDAGAYPLQVNGTIYDYPTGGIGLFISNPSSTADYAGIVLKGKSTFTSGQVATFYHDVNGNFVLNNGVSPGAYIWNNAASETMRANGGGELQIGSATDQGAYALQVTGSIWASANFIWNSTNNELYLGGVTDAGAYVLQGSTQYMTSNVTFKILETDGTAPTTTGTVEMVTVDANGLLSRQAIPGAGSGLTVGSSAITGGTTTRVLYNNAGVLGEYTVSGSGNVAMTTSPVFTTPSLGAATATTLTIGTLSYAPANRLASFQSSVNSYNQVIVQNTNTGATASAGFIVNNDQSTDVTIFGEFGMNSSGFTGTPVFNQPGYVFLTSTTRDLAIGTTTANAIHFATNNSTTDAMTISSAGLVTVTSDLRVTTAGTNAASVPTIGSTSTFTNKTIAFGSNTVSGTLAQFNTAVTDADLASLTGTETLTNKTIAYGSNTITGLPDNKDFGMSAPTASENIMVFFTTIPITITKVQEALAGTSPSVTYVLGYASARNGALTNIVNSHAATSTTGTAATLTANVSVPANSYIIVTTSATSGTVNDFHFTIEYTK